MKPEHQLAEAYIHAHPLEAARRLEDLSPQDAAGLLAPLAPMEVSAVLEHVLPQSGAAVMKHLPREVAIDVLTWLSSSTTIAILRQCEADLQAELLAHLETKNGPALRRALAYPDRTAGGLVDLRVLTLPPDINVAAALARVERDARRAIYYLYVLDRETKLIGVMSLKELLVADRQALIGSVMTTQVVTILANASVEELIAHPHWRVLHTLPVVDPSGHFLGALRYRTLRKIEEEAILTHAPGTLSAALLALWEAYSLAGIRLLTDAAELVFSPSSSEGSHSARDVQRDKR